MPGVVRTRVGYAGGTTRHPTYHRLGDHSETIQVDFDPERISFAELVELFWQSHNPTRWPWSRQYQPILFFNGAEQELVARESYEQLSKRLDQRVTTELRRLADFTLAEDYHQKYRLRSDSVLSGEFAAFYPRQRDLIDSTAAARVNGYLGGYGSRSQLETEIDLFGLSETGKRRLLQAVRR